MLFWVRFPGILFSLLSGFAVAAPRIITTSPAITELVYQLGHGEAIVGATEFCDYPAAAKALPRVGMLFSPSMEKTLLLKPDLVLLDAFTANASFQQALNALNINHQTVRIDSVEALFRESTLLNEKVFGVRSEILGRYQKLVDSLKRKARPFRFLVLTWVDPAIAASHSTFLSSLFELLGGVNEVPSSVHAPYLTLSREWLLTHSPDYTFVLSDEEVTAPFLKGKVIRLKPDVFSRTTFSALSGLETLEKELSR